VTDRLHVQVRLDHAAQELEDLVGDVGGPIGEHDGGAHGGRGGGGRARQVAGELDQVGEDAAARRGRDPLRRVAGVAAHVEALPGRVPERRFRAPAPAGIAGERRGRAGGEPEQTRREVRPAGDDQAALRAAEPALEALERPGGQVPRVRNEHRAIPGEPIVGEIGLLDDVVLEVAASEQAARGRGREIGVFALEPGARTRPRVAERVGLAARGRLGRVGGAAAPAEQDRDVVTSGTDPVLHRRNLAQPRTRDNARLELPKLGMSPVG
jgi:hypothetical protein